MDGGNDQSQAYYTQWEKQAYKMLSKSVNTSVGIPIPQLSATLGVSTSYETSSESRTQSRETNLFLVAQRLVQKTKVILKEETIQLTEDFKKRVESAKDIHELRQVFQKYGYFVPTTYIIGGKIIAEETETCSAKSDKTALSNKFAVGVSAKFDKAGFTASASGGYSQDKQNIDSESSADIASRTMMTLKGGDEGLINDGAKWISSLTLDRWQIVGYADLKPITDFLDPKLKEKCKTMLVNVTEVSAYDPQRREEQIVQDEWNANYCGPLKEFYADTNCLKIPKGKMLVGLAFRQKGGNRLAPKVFLSNLDGSNKEWIQDDDWNENYFGSLKDIYVDMNPVFIPNGKKLLGFAFRQHGNRLAPKILVGNVDGSDEKWIENNDWGHNYFPDKGGLSEIYGDTNEVFVNSGKKLVGFALRKKGANRLAPVLLVQ